MLGNFNALLSSVDFFQNHFFQKIHSGVSKGLDSVQDQQIVGPDLNRNCMQRVSADDKSHS